MLDGSITRRSFENCNLNYNTKSRSAWVKREGCNTCTKDFSDFGIVISFFFLLFFFFREKMRGNIWKQGIAILFQVGESHFGPVQTSNRGESLRDPPTFLTTREFLLYFVLTGSLLCYFGSRSNTSSLSSLILHEATQFWGSAIFSPIPNIESLFVINSYQLLPVLITQ